MPRVTVSFELKYQGKKGDENFDFKFMGKTWHFRNIGTSARTLNFRVQGELDDAQIWFHNSGSGVHRRCQRGDNRRCRTRRRWGRRRRRCTGGPWTTCTASNWSRGIQIHHFKINNNDRKVDFARRVTSCDPRSGNVTKKYKVNNGVFNHSGHYTISSSELEPYASIPMIEKEIYDDEVMEHSATISKADSINKKFNRLTGKHGQLQADYDELMAKYGLTGESLAETKKQNTTLQSRTMSMQVSTGDLQDQIDALQGQNANLQANLNSTQQKLLQNEADMYQDIEKENTNLIKENKDRSQTNSTFQQKTVYQNEAAKGFDKFNQYMFYVYYVLLAGLIVIIFIKDGKNSKQFYENIYYTLAFIIFLFLYPIYIFDIEIYALKFFNYIIAIFTSKLYNDQVY